MKNASSPRSIWKAELWELYGSSRTTKGRQFDAEDLRQLESIGRFAATAYRTVNVLHDSQQKSERLEATEAALRHQVSALEAAGARLAEANADLSYFAFAASHDLHEPLRAVKINSQLLLRRSDERLSEEEHLCISSIVDGCSRMEALITDLLAYAQAGEGDRISMRSSTSIWSLSGRSLT